VSAVLAVEDLSVAVNRYGEEHVVVDGVWFSVAEGEALAIVGESGSGKSLMALGAVDLLPPGARVTGGTTRLKGEALGELEEADWRHLVGIGVGVLLQDAIGSWDPLDFIGPQSGEVLEEHETLTDEEIRRRVEEALGEVRLPSRRLFGALPSEMSRGQAQRAMLAATLLSGPSVLIADEPLNGLDVTVARSVLSLIDDLRTKRGMALILVTHDMGVVASVADRVLVVYGGMIVEEAPVGPLYRSPQHPYTSGLLRSIPGLAPGQLEPIVGDVPEIFDLPDGCPFAPRCRFAIDACRERRPEPWLVGDSLVACVRAPDLDLPGIE
jgi:oligopeptide/dipeptide ABC transporter ATP-binding protein